MTIEKIASINKQSIIELFIKNVKNKTIDLSQYNKNHNGKEGHWLEKQMKIIHNSNNTTDILNYEMKKYSPKITFGDFGASEYLFTTDKTLNRTNFIKMFGDKNIKKNDRCSWSGKNSPSYFNEWTHNGQILLINDKKDIYIKYSFEKDNRDNKNEIISEKYKINDIIIALWKYDRMKLFIENKFNKNGFFICKKNDSNVYDKICFGKPFDYDHFIKCFEKKLIFFDSGMYEGNNRNYSSWRAYHNFWNELITDEY